MHEGPQPPATPPTQGSPGAPTPRRRPGHTWPLEYETNFNIPLLLAALSVGMVVLAALRLSDGRHVAALWITILLGVMLTFASTLQVVEQWRDIRLRRWILAHWDEIVRGQAELEGTVVAPGTVFVRYHVVLSMVLLSLSFPSRPALEGSAAARRTRRLAIVSTALGGWWFWTGPFSTVAAIRANLGGRTKKILLGEIADATVAARPLEEETWSA